MHEIMEVRNVSPLYILLGNSYILLRGLRTFAYGKHIVGWKIFPLTPKKKEKKVENSDLVTSKIYF